MLALLLQVSTTGQENIADHLRKAEQSVLIQSDPQSTSVTVQAAKYLNYYNKIKEMAIFTTLSQMLQFVSFMGAGEGETGLCSNQWPAATVVINLNL